MNSIFIKKRVAILVLFVSSLSLISHAAMPTPTAEQVAQFQRLSKAQQQQLIRQMGGDASILQMGNMGSVNQQPVQNQQVNRTTTRSIQQSSDKNSGLPLFGYDVIAGEGLGFLPIDNIPIPNDYIVAAGDSINIQLFGKVSQSYQLKINREGYLHFVDFGPVFVAGQTFAQMRKQIEQFVKQQVIGVDVVVTMGTMRTMQVYIVGESILPGAYSVNGLTTVVQALIASGGVKATGSLRNIQLKRKGRVVSTLDLYDLLIHGNAAGDVRLLDGDTLFIPIKSVTVSARGEVVRPAIYELKKNATLAQLIDFSGGLKPQTYLSKVAVKRVTQEGTKLFTLNLSSAKDKTFVLQNGDNVEFLKVATTLGNIISLRGEVVRQGAINYRKGMRVSDVVGDIDSDLKPNADLNYALIVREVTDDREVEVLQFSVAKALNNLMSQDNVELKKRDQIFIFDSGLQLNYWYGRQYNSSASTSNLQSIRQYERFDNETGAIIDENAIELNEPNEQSLSNSESVQLSSREQLLTPIIDRLKAQANYQQPAQLITITGAVKFPGTYPLAKKQTIKSLIEAAGGLLEQAYMQEGSISRNIKVEGEYLNQFSSFSLKEELDSDSPLALSANDVVMIKNQPTWQRGMVIDVQGEVMFPGSYTFQRGETIKDIINRAGGLTKFAYPEGAVLSRQRLKKQEQERLRLLNIQLKQEIASMTLRRQTSVVGYTSSPIEAMQVADELSSTIAMGRLVIDLPRAITGDPYANLMLEKGDKLFVPALSSTISIMGEVQYVSNQSYQPEMTVMQYIAAAGGTKKQADTDRIYVVRADGSVMLPNNSFWFSRSSEPLKPGDTIIVPIDTDYIDGLSTLTSATQILYQIGVAWSAVKN